MNEKYRFLMQIYNDVRYSHMALDQIKKKYNFLTEEHIKYLYCIAKYYM